jgi:hypothetical protein
MAVIRAMILEAVRTFETPVNSYQSTRRYNPEDSHLPRSEDDIKRGLKEIFCEHKK